MAWVHANYDAERAAPSVREAGRFVRALGAAPGSAEVFVDNNSHASRLGEDVARKAGWHYLAGTNAAREFSAWQEGLDHLRSFGTTERPQFVVFSNDTFLFHQPFRFFLRPLFMRAIVRQVESGERGWAIGQTERSPQVPDLDLYFSTAFFVLDWEALARIEFRIADPAVDSFFDDDLCGRFFVEDMNPAYERLLRSWLFYPSRKSWYAAYPLTPENASFMRGKATSILNEHSLSRRLVQNGVALHSCFEHRLFEVPLRVTYRVLQLL